MKYQEMTKEQLVQKLLKMEEEISALKKSESDFKNLRENLLRLGDIGKMLASDTEKNTEVVLDKEKTILIVDDNDTFREYVITILDIHGLNIIEAEDGEDAIEKCKQYEGPIDMLLTDVVMPGMNGKELSEKIRKLYPDIKILFMSGYSEDILVHPDVYDILNSEVNFLQKPFTSKDLIKKINMELNK